MTAAILTVTILNTILLLVIAWSIARKGGKEIEVSDVTKWEDRSADV